MITKEEFTAYVRVQASGVTNMFDLKNVMLLEKLGGTELTKQKCFEIMDSYGELSSMYGVTTRNCHE